MRLLREGRRNIFLNVLGDGDFLTSSEAAHIVSMIWEGEGFCPDGVMTGEYLRGYYNALLENRVKVTDGHATFFKKLRPGQKRGGGAENWLGRKSERVHISKHESLDDSKGVPNCPLGCVQDK